MEKECGSWLHQQQHLPWQSANLNSGSMLDVGWRNAAFQPCTTNPCVNMLSSVNEPRLHEFDSSELPHLKTSGQSSQQQVQGWFYGLPRYRQALTPIANPDHTKGFSEFPCECNGNGNGEVAPPKAVVVPRSNEEKRFLVFDQSGNQTNLIYSSLIGGSCTQQPQQTFYGNPITPISPPPPSPFDGFRGGSLQQFAKQTNELVVQIYETQQIFEDELDEIREIGESSEMHEDTEELNALLYSDDDDEYVDDVGDDDEISTGHSPSEMREEFKKGGVVEEDGEEVASFGGPIKRKRVQNNEEDELLSLVDTAISSGRRRGNGGWEKCLEEDDDDDTVSSFVEGRTLLSSNNNKRLKREKIRETVNILQSIIPTGGKGKDAMLILDEAIQYLKSLKVKVKSLEETL